MFSSLFTIYCIKSEGYGRTPCRINRFSRLQNLYSTSECTQNWSLGPFRGGRQSPPVSEANHSSPSNAELKNVRTYTVSHPQCFHGVHRGSYPNYFYCFWLLRKFFAEPVTAGYIDQISKTFYCIRSSTIVTAISPCQLSLYQLLCPLSITSDCNKPESVTLDSP